MASFTACTIVVPRMWPTRGMVNANLHRNVSCYAVSNDGIHWVRPKLGLFEFNGSTDNNIVWDGVEVHNFTPFKDANPACKPEQRYKALGWDPRAGGAYPGGLMAFQSADGIRLDTAATQAGDRPSRVRLPERGILGFHAATICGLPPQL